MRVLKNIAVNVCFSVFLFFSTVMAANEGPRGEHFVEIVVFLLSVAMTIVAPLAFGVRRFAVVVRTVAVVFAGFSVYCIAMSAAEKEFALVDEMTKHWARVAYFVTLIALQALYNKHNLLILLGLRRDFGSKTTPPVIFD